MERCSYAQTAPLPTNETARLQSLERYKLWHTAPDAGLDRLTRLAAEHFQVSTALISLVGQDQQWFKSRVGLAACETSRDVSFCAHAILREDVFVVPDAAADPRFKDNPLVTGPPWIRFYAGAPLEVDTDIRIGSFCIIDGKPRPRGFSDRERNFLKELAALAVGTFDHYLNRSLFEASPAAVYVLDLDTLAFLSCNTAAVNLLGYTVAELERMSLHDVLDTDSSPIRAERDFAIKQSGPWKYKAKSGREVLALATSRKISYLGRNAAISILTDITEITETQQRLSLALEAAEGAAQAKAQFLATMSHELRTPLNHIIGMAGLLLSTDVSEEQREFAEVICSSGNLLESIVSDILKYSQEDSGKLQSMVFSPEAVVHAAVGKWSEECARKAVELRSTVAQDVPAEVIGDFSRIGDVLDRLVSNAVKFTSTGSIQIELKAVYETGKTLQLRFCVVDSGIGVSEELTGTIFAPFSQEDASHTRQFGGTGLGLAICRRIVDQLNGSIDFSSAKDVGSRFWFSVPVAV